MACSCDSAEAARAGDEEFFEAIAAGVAADDRMKSRLIEIAVIEFLLITFVICFRAFVNKRII